MDSFLNYFLRFRVILFANFPPFLNPNLPTCLVGSTILSTACRQLRSPKVNTCHHRNKIIKTRQKNTKQKNSLLENQPVTHQDTLLITWLFLSFSFRFKKSSINPGCVSTAVAMNSRIAILSLTSCKNKITSTE